MPFTKQTHCKQGHEYTDSNVYVATHADGRQYRQCRICHNAAGKAAYHAMTPEQRRERNASFPSRTKLKYYQRKHRFAKKYGITVEAAKALLVEQDGLCAICYETEPATHLDHDHKTGQVRGWLCARCNWGLGHFDDDVERMRNALAYLEEVA